MEYISICVGLHGNKSHRVNICCNFLLNNEEDLELDWTLTRFIEHPLSVRLSMAILW